VVLNVIILKTGLEIWIFYLLVRSGSGVAKKCIGGWTLAGHLLIQEIQPETTSMFMGANINQLRYPRGITC
jgi:hypothetical protein